VSNPESRVEKVLALYRELNGGTGSDSSHIRDLIIDLLHYVDSKNQGISSYELLAIASDMFSEEKVEEYRDNEKPLDS